MPNVQQQEMRRSKQTPLTQDSVGPPSAGSSRPRKERRSIPDEQLSPHGPKGRLRSTASDEPAGRPAEGE